MKKAFLNALWFREITFVSVLLFISSFGNATDEERNPFILSFPEKEQLTNDDYLNIQQQLRNISLDHLLKELYPVNKGFSTYNDFEKRCKQGLNLVLLDPVEGLYPTSSYEKIGNGGDHCIVSYSSFNTKYPEYIQTIGNALKATGFNGYFFYRIGGFPNPSGKEIKYAGVPYAFKMFMLLEAYKKGFHKVLWIDSACIPLKNPETLFNRIEKTGSCLMGWKVADYDWRYIFPRTRQLLKEFTGIDVAESIHISTGIFGFNMEDPKVQLFFQSYLKLLEMGTPFLSCFPEEFVFAALLGKDEFAAWKPLPFKFVLSEPVNEDEIQTKMKSKEVSSIFLHRKH
jgi:hypothetical protein